jgi:hypothetical protein
MLDDGRFGVGEVDGEQRRAGRAVGGSADAVSGAGRAGAARPGSGAPLLRCGCGREDSVRRCSAYMLFCRLSPLNVFAVPVSLYIHFFVRYEDQPVKAGRPCRCQDGCLLFLRCWHSFQDNEPVRPFVSSIMVSPFCVEYHGFALLCRASWFRPFVSSIMVSQRVNCTGTASTKAASLFTESTKKRTHKFKRKGKGLATHELVDATFRSPVGHALS